MKDLKTILESKPKVEDYDCQPYGYINALQNYINKLEAAINYSRCCTTLKDKEVNDIEIKTLGDLKRAYPEGRLHTVNSYGKIINYSVDGEIVYTRHL